MKRCTSKSNFKCKHCRDTDYVFVYWLEKALMKLEIHMVDLPQEIFKAIDVEYFTNCHCHPGLLLPSKISEGSMRCLECCGSTWRFTELAEECGYRWKKVMELSAQQLLNLPCNYFERCSCGYDEDTPNSPERESAVKKILNLTRFKLPRFGFNFAQSV